tara:strand:+ start:628 stop:876 length:249 start_codon:yes stop_codon:yes gene_type:complete
MANSDLDKVLEYVNSSANVARANNDLNKVLEYVNGSANKARDLMFEEISNNTIHITTIIVCEQIAKFVKKLQEKNKENGNNN